MRRSAQKYISSTFIKKTCPVLKSARRSMQVETCYTRKSEKDT